MARADDEYLFDALKKPAYRKAWTAMLSGEKNIPGWLIAFGKGGLIFLPGRYRRRIHPFCQSLRGDL